MPTTPEEKSLCISRAEELLHVPIDSYDLWAGNFLVSDQVDPATSLPRPYYIDRDIPETIAQQGYSPDTAELRRPKYEEGKAKMK